MPSWIRFNSRAKVRGAERRMMREAIRAYAADQKTTVEKLFSNQSDPEAKKKRLAFNERQRQARQEKA